jgi:hypothetical protein
VSRASQRNASHAHLSGVATRIPDSLSQVSCAARPEWNRTRHPRGWTSGGVRWRPLNPTRSISFGRVPPPWIQRPARPETTVCSGTAFARVEARSSLVRGRSRGAAKPGARGTTIPSRIMRPRGIAPTSRSVTRSTSSGWRSNAVRASGRVRPGENFATRRTSESDRATPVERPGTPEVP